jgi:hypothetical protein
MDAASALATRRWPMLRPSPCNASAFSARDDLDREAAVIVVQPSQHEIAARYRAAGAEVCVFDGAAQPSSLAPPCPPERAVPLHVVTDVDSGRPARRRAVG